MNVQVGKYDATDIYNLICILTTALTSLSDPNNGSGYLMTFQEIRMFISKVEC